MLTNSTMVRLGTIIVINNIAYMHQNFCWNNKFLNLKID